VHEVNNALNPVLAAAYLLEQKSDDAATVREVAVQLRRAAEELTRQTRLVSAMLKPGHLGTPERRPTPAVGTVPVPDVETSRRLATAPVPIIRVLVADDMVDDRSLIAEVLRTLGHDVVALATTGEEAVLRARETNPDVVLLDVRMPDGSGIDAAYQLRTAMPDVAVVLYTGDASLDLTETALEESSALAVLPKPAAPNALDASLRLAVRRARELRQARAEAADAKQQLENRKLVERAKGMIMQRMQVSEPEAYRFLQKTSQNRAVPIVEVARVILENDGVVR
jgi:two-component system, response regulator PdtaR